MQRRAFLSGGLALLAAPLAAEAQQAGKAVKIGVLLPQSASLSVPMVTALRDGLKQLGYIEGQSIVIEYRFADGKFDRLPGLTAELIGAQVQILVVGGTTPAQVAKKVHRQSRSCSQESATRSRRAGRVFCTPAENATGFSTAHEDGFAGKWVELLREVVPRATRVIVIHNPTNPSNIRYWRDIKIAARG